jgi:hypothetical protein
MLRGSAEIKVVKHDMGFIPVIIKILYDGHQFGEPANLKANETICQEVVDHLME